MADLINTLTPAVNYSANELTPTGYLDATLNTVVYAHNYNDLSNKPSINGVTLKGNKTPVQLGLLTAEDIPVTSVNGQTGDVSLSGSNLMYNQNTTINEAIDDVAEQIPTVPVQTVNGLTGNVVLTGNNVNYNVGESINHKIDELAGQIVGSGVSSVNGKTGVVTLNGTDIQYDVNKNINQAIDAVAAQIPTVPVQSVNNKIGSVILTGDDIDYSEGVSVNDQISANTTVIGGLIYDVGDSISITNAIFTGYTSNSSQRVQFFIPLSKPLRSTITGANIEGDFTIYSVNASEVIVNSSTVGSWTVALKDNGVYFRYDLNSQMTTTNRSVVAVLFGTGSKITFT